MKKVFVADDNFGYLYWLNTQFTKKGCYVRTFSRSESLFEALDESLPDLVMLNTNLDGESSSSICKEIKSRYNNSVPVVVASEDQSLLKGKNDCADAVLYKPLDSEEISRLLNTTLLQ